MRWELSGTLDSLLARGVARWSGDGLVDLHVDEATAAEGGMITISMRVPVRRDDAVVEELFSAWLAVRPGVADGTTLTPSAWLPGMIAPVYFRVRRTP